MLFASVDLPLLDKKLAAREILLLPNECTYWDKYRNTRMVPLMSRNGATSRIEVSKNGEGKFIWTPFAPKVIVNWFDNIVFPWMGMQSRVMALITQSNSANYEHIDCNPDELNSQQHKFRIVLQGKTDTLYFITKDGNIHVPNVDGSFIMDGGWPHGMDNYTNEIKVTLAVGSPWIGNDHYGNIKVLLDRHNYSMPDDLSAYWWQKN
jgi:hypothetical protein